MNERSNTRHSLFSFVLTSHNLVAPGNPPLLANCQILKYREKEGEREEGGCPSHPIMAGLWTSFHKAGLLDPVHDTE